MIHAVFLALALAGAPADTAPPPDRDTAAVRGEILRIEKERKEVDRALRVERRKRHHLLVGFGAGFLLIEEGWQFERDTIRITELAPALGFGIGYRRHLARKLGLRLGTRAFLGPTLVNLTYDKSEGGAFRIPDVVTSNGAEGVSYFLNASGQAIIGPLGKIVLEPGIGFTAGGHSAESIHLEGDAGESDYRPQAAYFSLNGIMGASVYLGKEERSNLTVAILFGVGSESRIYYQVNAAYDFAIPIGS